MVLFLAQKTLGEIKREFYVMARKPTGNPNGRPLTKIDKSEFEGCCKILCTKDEICDIFGIDEKTLTAWCKRTYRAGFSDVYKRFSSDGKKSLRRYQFELAEKNPTMAIWLGKNLLGQKDEVAIDHGGNELLSALSDLARKNMNND